MDKGITVAGNLIVDHVKSIDAYPEAGLLANIRQMKYCIGGCAGNTVMDLAVMDEGLPLSCLGRVGDDEMGEYILGLLASRRIQTSGIRKSEKPTSFTDVLSDMSSGSRTFFHSRGANEDFCYGDIDFSGLSASIFHIGYALLLDGFDLEDSAYGTVMARTLAEVRRMGIKTSLDVVSENSGRFKKIVVPSLRYCSYAVMNEVEAGMVTEIPPRDAQGKVIAGNIKEMCKRMLDFGVEEYVVIHMPEMGCAMGRDGSYWAVGSYEIPQADIRGTVGAGDAFCAGILYALYREWDIERALVFANGAAACNLLAEDSVSGMKPATEIEKIPYQLRKI